MTKTDDDIKLENENKSGNFPENTISHVNKINGKDYKKSCMIIFLKEAKNIKYNIFHMIKLLQRIKNNIIDLK